MAPHNSYVQLSLRERDRVAILRAQGVSLREIGRRIRRDASTISREIRRNGGQIYDAYGGGKAHQRATARKRAAGRRERLKTPGLRAYVRARLRLGWSPEQIAGALRKARGRKHSATISHEAIYQYVYLPRVRRQENLVPCLTRAHRHRQLKGHRHTHRDPHIPERVSILQRPKRIEERREFGHWERDGVETRKGKCGLSVLVERKSRFVKITKIAARTARNTSRAMTRVLSHYPKGMRRSVTYDNGKENVEHLRVNKIVGTQSYFCEPYHSWEKGTVENTIGLIRRVFPKATNFDGVTVKQVKRLEQQMNNRPRKTLNFSTPKTIFHRGVALTR
jgi:IS30 family transposase